MDDKTINQYVYYEEQFPDQLKAFYEGVSIDQTLLHAGVEKAEKVSWQGEKR